MQCYSLNISSVVMLGVACISMVAGCSEKEWVVHPTATKVSHISAVAGVDISDMKKIAVLPFADYSQSQTGENNTSSDVNQRILEEVTDYFVAHGIEVAVQEDVIALLREHNILVVGTNSLDRGTPDWEYRTRHHMEKMQEDLSNMMADDSKWGTGDGKTSASKDDNKGSLGGISKSFLKIMADDLGVDKVLRGRIIDYGIGVNKSLNPANGILSVALGGVAEGLGVYARREGYERGLPPDSFLPKSVRGSSLEMDIPPNERHSNVQLRVYLQDVNSGKVLWSNRAFVRYTPESNLRFADNHPQNMLDTAMREAVKELMGDLFKESSNAQEGWTVVEG